MWSCRNDFVIQKFLPQLVCQQHGAFSIKRYFYLGIFLTLDHFDNICVYFCQSKFARLGSWHIAETKVYIFYKINNLKWSSLTGLVLTTKPTNIWRWNEDAIVAHSNLLLNKRLCFSWSLWGSGGALGALIALSMVLLLSVFAASVVAQDRDFNRKDYIWGAICGPQLS